MTKYRVDWETDYVEYTTAYFSKDFDNEEEAKEFKNALTSGSNVDEWEYHIYTKFHESEQGESEEPRIVENHD